MSVDQTQIDHLVRLIAQQDALQVQINRLIAQRASTPLSIKNGLALVSAFAYTPYSICILAINRLGNHCKRPRKNRGENSRTIVDQSSER